MDVDHYLVDLGHSLVASSVLLVVSIGIGVSSWEERIFGDINLTAKVTKPNPRLLPVSRSKATKESSICENGCEVSKNQILQSTQGSHLSKLREEIGKVLLLRLPGQVSDDCSRHKKSGSKQDT